MATTRKPAPPRAPLDPHDAEIGRRVREFFEWTTLLVSWVVSGLITVVAYRTYPAGGLVGALVIDAVAGLLFVLVVLRWSRG